MSNMMRELSGETVYEWRLFSGFQDSYLDRGMIFEPNLCMEITQRRIENEKKIQMQKQKQIKCKKE